jgi:hypothetical protein
MEIAHRKDRSQGLQNIHEIISLFEKRVIERKH